ncbi:MAG: uroporphyrinogen-III synthase [Acidobacteria bacterium]|nr:uroporphyrinogen-III synthase [Acidobacteriota bacterium]
MENQTDLHGKRIALLEARMGSELANLIKRHGGEPIQAPALREVSINAGPEVNALIDKLQTGAIAFVIFQTGVGVAGLLSEAERLQRKDELLALLQTVTTIARGPKPTAVLSRNQIKPTFNTPEPYTTTELIAVIDELNVTDKNVAVLHYGERNQALAEALQTRGAILHELCLYEWQMPEDITPLRNLMGDLIAGKVDAVAFTSQIQARHLFQLAADSGCEENLRAALNHKTVVASIGPTCTATLEGFGVPPRVEPEHPKMGPMVLALKEYFTAE